MTPTDRWIMLGFFLGWTCTVLIVGYSFGMQSCSGLSFGFY